MKLLLTFLLSLSSLCVSAQNVALFETTAEGAVHPYRIPAIACTTTGRLIAVCDYRINNSDIGCSELNGGRIDILVRYSDDNGESWSPIETLVAGMGDNGAHAGYGDPAIVADRETGEVVVFTCTGSGKDSFWSGNQASARFLSKDNGKTWERTNVWDAAYKKQLLPNVHGWFMTSGKVCQSSKIKVGSHYRIYMAVDCCQQGNVLGGNYVLYSDNLGESWSVLGSNLEPCVTGAHDWRNNVGGDEAKVEELPDGSVLISSRDKSQTGRIFNRWTYSDQALAQGEWSAQVLSNHTNNGCKVTSNDTNGEILILPVTRTADNRQTYLALQSVPFGPKRANVGIYYKALDTPLDWQSLRLFARGWTAFPVTTLSSAYSTMIQQQDGRIAFFWEDNYQGEGVGYGGGYSLIYRPLTIQEITNGKYK